MIFKLFARFVFWAVILIIILLSNIIPSNFIPIMAHKAATIIIAYLTAEAIWITSYRLLLGSFESKLGRQSAVPMAIFRGLLYAAIILGFSIGI